MCHCHCPAYKQGLNIGMVREHLEQEDAELERIAQAAAQGKLRGKRRSGLALDDSEDEEEDEEARRIRGRMHKKRRVDGDTLDALGESRNVFKTWFSLTCRVTS